MSFHTFILLFWLSGYVLAAEKQLGVEYTGMNVLENEKIQRECGLADPRSSKPTNKVLYGMNVTSEEALRETRWMVSIGVNGGSCSGVLISRRHVLTAAHCQGIGSNDKTKCNEEPGNFTHSQKYTATNVSMYNIRVYTRFGHRLDSNAGRTYTVKRIIYPASYTIDGDVDRHICPSFNEDTEDIAIYELLTPVALPSFVCLANVDLPNNTLTNYGFGSTGLDRDIYIKEPFILKKHNVKYTDCGNNSVYNGVTCLTHVSELDVSSACPGDSGGPVVGNHNNRTVTVGLMSYGPHKCPDARHKLEQKVSQTLTMMITSVPYYKNWICKWTGICVYGADPTKDNRPTAIREQNEEQKVL